MTTDPTLPPPIKEPVTPEVPSLPVFELTPKDLYTGGSMIIAAKTLAAARRAAESTHESGVTKWFGYRLKGVTYKSPIPKQENLSKPIILSDQIYIE